MIRPDVYCNNYLCNKYNCCDRSFWAIPGDGTEVITVNLEDTEFCKKLMDRESNTNEVS